MHPVYYVPDAVALDFDKTVADTNACLARLEFAAGAMGLDTSGIRTAGRDPLTHLWAQLDRDGRLQLWHKFVYAGQPSILFPDAFRLLWRLQHQDVPHFFLTFGANRPWQQLKLATANYPNGRIIMTDMAKGPFIRTLRRPDGRFGFQLIGANGAVYLARRIVLIDDRFGNFDGLPEDCRGFVLLQEGLASLENVCLPRNVTPLASMDNLDIDGGRIVEGDYTLHEPPPMYQRRTLGNSRPRFGIYAPLNPDGSLPERIWNR